MNEWTVILVRQPFMENVRYKFTDKYNATERAYSLARLHPKCTVSVIAASRRIWVHASAFYARKEQ